MYKNLKSAMFWSVVAGLGIGMTLEALKKEKERPNLGWWLRLTAEDMDRMMDGGSTTFFYHDEQFIVRRDQ